MLKSRLNRVSHFLGFRLPDSLLVPLLGRGGNFLRHHSLTGGAEAIMDSWHWLGETSDQDSTQNGLMCTHPSMHAVKRFLF